MLKSQLPFKLQSTVKNQYDRTDGLPADGPKGAVLVVDNQMSIRNMTSLMLSDAGYEVTVAENGSAGLILCDQMFFDLVAADETMTDGSNRNFATILKKRFPETPLILFTDGNDSDLTGSEIPFDAVLFRPFTSAIY